MVSNWKTPFFVAVLFIFYTATGFYYYNSFGSPNNTQDFVFHFGQAKGIDWEDDYWQEFHDRGVPPNHNYPPVYHLIAQPFTSSEFNFYFFNLCLILVIIPVLLFGIARNDWVVPIYLCGVSFAQASIFSATYPQVLTFIFILTYLNCRKNFNVWLLMGLLATNTHSTGLMVFLLIGIAEVIDSIAKKISIPFPAGMVWLKEASIQNPSQAFISFFSMTPLPVIYFGLKKEAFSLFLITVSIISSIQDIRAIYLAQIILVIHASKNIQTKQKRIRNGFLLYLIVQGLYYLMDFSLATHRLILIN